jgi:hypothetical protein
VLGMIRSGNATEGALGDSVWGFGQKYAWYKIPFICLFLNNSGDRRLFEFGIATQSIFLPFMCRLRFFEVHIGLSATIHDFSLLSFFMESLCISLTSPATLEHLKLNIRFRGSNIYNSDPNAFYENLRHADVWRHLDSITTLPTGSRLRRVDIIH